MLKRPLPQRECTDGWNQLIDTLVADLDLMTGKREVEVVQIKEKFGALRFYLSRNTALPTELLHRMQVRIQESEKISAVTCEECGQPGMIHPWDGMGYYCARCQLHAREIARANISSFRGKGWKLDGSWRLVDNSGRELAAKAVRQFDMAAEQAALKFAEEKRQWEVGMTALIQQRTGETPNIRIHLSTEAAHDWRAARFLAE